MVQILIFTIIKLHKLPIKKEKILNTLILIKLNKPEKKYFLQFI